MPQTAVMFALQSSDLIFYGGLAILAHSLMGLVAVWVAFGRAHWFLRLAALGGLLALGLPVPAYDLMLVFLMQSVLVVVPLWLIRRRAVSIRARSLDADEATDRALRTRWQFSLLDLLLAAVVVAALAAFLGSVPARDWQRLGFGDFLAALLAAASTLVGAWAGLGKRLAWLRLVLLLLLPASALAAAGLMLGRLVPLRLIPLLLVPSSLVIACWLALMRLSGYGWIGKRETGPCPAVTTKPARRRVLLTWVARLASLTLSLAILAPLGVVYYLLLEPLPVFQTALPPENGYPALVEAGETFQRVGVPDVDTATPKQLRTFVTQHGRLLDEARHALDRPCQAQLDYSLSDSLYRAMAIRRLGQAFLAEGRLAETEGRTADAAQTYLTLIRLGHAVGRGGLILDAITGWNLEELGGTALYGLRDRLAPEQCGQLTAELAALDARREPVDDVLLRDRIGAAHAGEECCGWWSRLYDIKSNLFPVVRANIPDSARRQQAKTRLLICELGIRMYQSEHGSLPQALADLVPDYLPTVPQDPFGQGPLVYRQTPTGYLLYSVGRDGRDDRGQPYKRSSSGEFLGGDLLLEERPDDESGEL